MSALRGYYGLSGDIIRASGEGIISALGGYHDLCGDIISALGWVQCIEGVS